MSRPSDIPDLLHTPPDSTTQASLDQV